MFSGQTSSQTRHDNAYLPYHRDQRPKICRAHVYYADKARTCTRWGRWPASKPQFIYSRDNSRSSSRESSPIRQSSTN